MTKRTPFTEKLLGSVERNESLLCVGLDPDPKRMPKGFDPRPRDIVKFNLKIIEATSDLVCAYKPNLAFYLALGKRGWRTLIRTIDAIPQHIPVIIDAKSNDIGNTAKMWAKAIFGELGADAVTVNPLLGTDSLEPFFAWEDRGAFALCLTSNPGSRDFQMRNKLHLQIARKCQQSWRKKNDHVGLVVGATHPRALADVRALCPDRILLLPGVGAQGGDLEASLRAGLGKRGHGIIINASRSIIHASPAKDFAEAARAEANKTREAILRCLEQIESSKPSTRSSAKS